MEWKELLYRSQVRVSRLTLDLKVEYVLHQVACEINERTDLSGLEWCVFFYYLGTDRGHGEMVRTTRQDRMVLDALWSDPTESDEVLGVHVRNSVSEVLGIQDVVSQCQSGVSSWEEYMPFWTWQSKGGKRFEEKKVQYSKCVPVCTVSGLILVAPASCRNSTRETLWNSSSVLTNVPDAQMWPAYWGWSLATPPGPFSQKLFRRNNSVKILLTRVGDRMILEISKIHSRFSPKNLEICFVSWGSTWLWVLCGWPATDSFFG